MSKTRRKYSNSFKNKAVELSNHRGNVREVALELGIEPNMINRWRRERDQYAHNSFPGQGNPKMTDQEKEIAKLRSELTDVRIERDILKKAISIFSLDDKKSSGL